MIIITRLRRLSVWKLCLHYIRYENIGSLIPSSGTITRREEIRPEHIYGYFAKSCYVCSSEDKDVELQFRYTEWSQVGMCGSLKEADVLPEMSQHHKDIVITMQKPLSLYERMADSITSTIFGHNQIKRGILLILFGGVHLEPGEGVKLRRDYNISIVGDPNTAKTQFLKYVDTFPHRAIYTYDKACSAAGDRTRREGHGHRRVRDRSERAHARG
eukprot:684772_1